MASVANLWGLEDLAAELDISSRELARKIKDLAPDKVAGGDVRKYKKWTMARVVRHIYQDHEVSTQEAKARLDTLRADQIEHRLAVEKGEYAPIEILEGALSEVSNTIASVLKSLPQRIKRVSSTVSGDDIELIRLEISRLSNELADVELYK